MGSKVSIKWPKSLLKLNNLFLWKAGSLDWVKRSFAWCTRREWILKKKLCGGHLVFAIWNSFCNFWRISEARTWNSFERSLLRVHVQKWPWCRYANNSKTVYSIPFDIKWGAKWIKLDLWDSWRLRKVQTHQFSLKKWHSSYSWSTLQLYMYIMWAEIICIYLNFAHIIIIIISPSFHFM